MLFEHDRDLRVHLKVSDVCFKLFSLTARLTFGILVLFFRGYITKVKAKAKLLGIGKNFIYIRKLHLMQ